MIVMVYQWLQPLIIKRMQNSTFCLFSENRFLSLCPTLNTFLKNPLAKRQMQQYDFKLLIKYVKYFTNKNEPLQSSIL